MVDVFVLTVIVIAMALIFDFTNGWNDSANAIATVVATRVMKPLHAVLLAAVLNMVGAFAFTAVAKMIYSGFVNPGEIDNLYVVMALLVGSILWNVVMTLLGLPISASHSLIGGILGAAVAYGGFGILIVGGIVKVLVAMLVSPLLGALLALLLMKLLNRIVANRPPSKVKKAFGILQIVSVSFMAFSHGTNDAQKAMGIIMMALVIGGYAAADADIPLWVIASAGFMIALGTAMGGWKVIKTLGMRLSKLEPIHGFAAETAAAAILTTVSRIGVPVSSTHTITGAIIGVGLSRRVKSVRWGIAGKIVYAWIFTLPGTAVLAFLTYKLIEILGWSH